LWPEKLKPAPAPPKMTEYVEMVGLKAQLTQKQRDTAGLLVNTVDGCAGMCAASMATPANCDANELHELSLYEKNGFKAHAPEALLANKP